MAQQASDRRWPHGSVGRQQNLMFSMTRSMHTRRRKVRMETAPNRLGRGLALGCSDLQFFVTCHAARSSSYLFSSTPESIMKKIMKIIIIIQDHVAQIQRSTCRDFICFSSTRHVCSLPRISRFLRLSTDTIHQTTVNSTSSASLFMALLHGCQSHSSLKSHIGKGHRLRSNQSTSGVLPKKLGQHRFEKWSETSNHVCDGSGPIFE